jgi:hypothetical protein
MCRIMQENEHDGQRGAGAVLLRNRCVRAACDPSTMIGYRLQGYPQQGSARIQNSPQYIYDEIPLLFLTFISITPCCPR